MRDRQQAICRELRVSRKVVRKVLRSEATEFRYEREEQPRLGRWLEDLEHEARSIRYQITIAKLALAKDVADFKFGDTPINDQRHLS
jgi:hypothetical protein